ncbi:MAG: Xaa-Pro peptidase family protein [Armatimonadota bacterium]|nr:Xaa-Pro peptidase family protein [Armatimonadota bacterium]
MTHPLLNRDRAAAVMDGHDLVALIAATFQNVYYASGFWSFGQSLSRATQVYAVLPRGALDRPAVVHGIGEADMAAQFPTVGTLHAFGTFFIEPGALGGADGDPADERLRRYVVESTPLPRAEEALTAALQAVGVGRGRVGIDDGVPPEVLSHLQRQCPDLVFVPAGRAWRTIRAVKTAEEVRRLERAARIVEDAVTAALAAVRDGMTEREMAQVFDAAVVEGGGYPLFTVIAFGAHSAYPNAAPGDRRLRRGDLIRFDVGCRYEGYCSDIARTAVFGEPSPAQTKAYRAILAGEDAALAAVRPGASAADVFAAAVERTRASGLPHYRRHHVGHGVGLEIYDDPLLAADASARLEAGMVLEVETPYYELGFGGVQVEDTALVTESGVRLLTRGDRGLRRV